MDKYEARLAVETASICKFNGLLYYAYGIEWGRTARGSLQLSIILHDRRANSVIVAKLEDVEVVSWNLLPEMVEQTLLKYRASG